MGRKRSKRYEAAAGNVPDGKVSIPEAVKAVKAFPAGGFDQTVELVNTHLAAARAK